jgi:predicted RNase H-like HicB family nuclease
LKPASDKQNSSKWVQRRYENTFQRVLCTSRRVQPLAHGVGDEYAKALVVFADGNRLLISRAIIQTEAGIEPEAAMEQTRQEYYIVIERDEDGFFVGEAPQLRACYSQGRTLDELMANMREVIELCLEDEAELGPLPEFVGIQKILV